MKMRTLISLITITLATACFSPVTLADITGTTSVQATFTSTIEAGTCTAQIQSAGGQAISTLAFGDVFKSELVAANPSTLRSATAWVLNPQVFRPLPAAVAAVLARILTVIHSPRARPPALRSGRERQARERC